MIIRQPNDYTCFEASNDMDCSIESSTTEYLGAFGDDEDGAFCELCSDEVSISTGRFCCQEPACLNVVCLDCVSKNIDEKRCVSCHHLFLTFCSSHHCRKRGTQTCNSCLIHSKFSAMSMHGVSKDIIQGKIEDMKQQAHQHLSFEEALSQKSFTGATRKIVSFNINGSSAKGNVQRRKIVGEAFLAACKADIILLQDSPWSESKIMNHFNEDEAVRHYEVVGSKCAAIAFDTKTFQQHDHANRTTDYETFKPPEEYEDIEFYEIGHSVAAKDNRVLANIFYLLDRTTIMVLREIGTDTLIVVASYHGPWSSVSETLAQQIRLWLESLVAWYGSTFKCEYILGGDFNIDISHCASVIPTHNHDPRRANNLDWIVVSSVGILLGEVNYSSLFPLPPHNGAIGADCCLLEPVQFPNFNSEIDTFWPWDENRWNLLAQILSREKKSVLWINESPPASIFDHSPIHAFFSLT